MFVALSRHMVNAAGATNRWQGKVGAGKSAPACDATGSTPEEANQRYKQPVGRDQVTGDVVEVKRQGNERTTCHAGLLLLLRQPKDLKQRVFGPVTPCAS